MTSDQVMTMVSGKVMTIKSGKMIDDNYALRLVKKTTEKLINLSL